MISDFLNGLPAEHRKCIERLLEYGHRKPDISSVPKPKLAAVLALLYIESGKLRVLLTTRAMNLRTHGGQTALPGGRVDETDTGFVETALREAHEEVGLPVDCPDIHVLCLLDPFISSHRIIVTPVVAFLSDPSIISGLKAAEDEVSHIFSHPLEAILDPLSMKGEPLVDMGSDDWFYPEAFYNTNDPLIPLLNNLPYRQHRLRSSASPVKGLTADILITVAEIAFQRPPSYERYAPGQPHELEDYLKLVHEKAAS